MPEAPGPDDRAALTIGEVAVGLAVVEVTIVATVSLGLALWGAHDLPAVLAVSAAALALLLGVAIFWGRPRVRILLRWSEVGALLVIAILASVLFFPGFPYAAADKDPGIYVVHGIAIAREGSTVIDDEIGALDGTLPVQYFGAGARFPGLWHEQDRPATMRPQFYHLFPSLLATAFDLAGTTAIFQLNPLLAVLTVLATTLAVRRGFGWPTALVAAALLSTHMLQVWQAKYPATEILTQLFVAGATLGVVIAIETRWRPAAGVAGLLVGSAWLARPDGFLVVFLALAVLGALYAVDRFDERSWWFLAGLGASLPLVLYQAYVTSGSYSETTEVPAPWMVAAFALAMVAVAFVGRRLAPRLRPLYRPRALGGFLVGLCVTIGVVAWNRSSWFGIDWIDRNGTLIRSYDEQTLHRLALFFTLPGLLLVVAGVAVIALRPWRAVQWAIVGPGLALLPVYLYAARISPQMMWWGRRFIPMVLVAMVVLIAAAIGWLLDNHGRYTIGTRALGALATLFLLTTYLGQSLPLRDHAEFAGSYSFVKHIGAIAGGEPAVFLWEFPGGSILDPARTFAGALFLVDDQLSAFLPKEEPNDPFLDEYLDHFGDDHAIYVITRGFDEPAGFDTSRLLLVDTLHVEMPIWDDSRTERPKESTASQGEPVWFDVSIWRVTGPSELDPPIPNPLTVPTTTTSAPVTTAPASAP